MKLLNSPVMTLALTLTAVFVLIGSPRAFAEASDAAPKQVFVFELLDSNDAAAAGSARRLIAQEILEGVLFLQKHGYHVADPQQVAALIRCHTDAECFSAAREQGAHLIVSGEIFLVQGTYHLTLNLTDVTRQPMKVVSKVSHQYGSLKELTDDAMSTARFLVVRGLELGPSNKSDDPRVLTYFLSDPPGAIVRVDGELVCQSTPCSSPVFAGSHQITMEKERYHDARARRDIRGHQEISLSLKPKFGRLSVSTRPPNLDLEIDGIQVGRELRHRELDPRTYEVYVVDRCYQRRGERVIIKEGKDEEIVILTQPIMTALDIKPLDENGTVIEAQVDLGGDRLGDAPRVFSVPLCIGTVVVSTRDGRRWMGHPDLLPDRTNSLDVVLSRPPTPPRDARGGISISPWFIIAGVGGVVAGGSEIYRYTLNQDLKSLPPGDPGVRSKLNQAKTFEAVTLIGLGISGVSILGYFWTRDYSK